MHYNNNTHSGFLLLNKSERYNIIATVKVLYAANIVRLIMSMHESVVSHKLMLV